MSATRFLPAASLDALFAALLKDGRRILAPTDRDGRTELNRVTSPGEVAQDHLQTILSAKEAAFPKVERLLSFQLGKGAVELQDAEPGAAPTVLFALRPCEARGFQALDAVFNWDTRDRFFNARMERLAIIGLSCTRSDEACFCTSVGGGPGDTAGSDLLLTPAPGGFLAEILTPKGEAIVQLAPEAFRPDPGLDKRVADVPVRFDAPGLTAKLKSMFDDGLWAEQSLRCVGCGACAFVCPTCVCFDLVEEADAKGGRRLRTWDSCGYHMFTLHASGHNPRETQGQRWRQRVFHKFSYYPERYRMLGCVGCGKCTRACPVDMNLAEHLAQAFQA
jgi:formate hydrogenlyase subunit 6/NADH:ubiquinone oxidoreductase subunit I